MAKYIHSVRNGRCVINLEETKKSLEESLPVVSKIASEGRKILFVGTKRQSRQIFKKPLK